MITDTPRSPEKKGDEVELWVASKFNEDWIGEKNASYLNVDTLSSLLSNEEKFRYLETPVKLRLIMSCLAMKKNQLSQLREHFAKLLEHGKNDHDDWVRVISEILSSFPENNCLNLSVTHPSFDQCVRDFEAKFKLDDEAAEDKQSSLQSITRKYLNSPNDTNLDNVHFHLKKTHDELLDPSKELDKFCKSASKPSSPPSPQREEQDNDQSETFSSTSSSSAGTAIDYKKMLQKKQQVQRDMASKRSQIMSSGKKMGSLNSKKHPNSEKGFTFSKSLTEATSTHRVMKQIAPSEAIAKMKEQHEAARKVKSTRNEDTEMEKERRRRERQEAKERKEQEKLERKRKREEEKRKKQEEGKKKPRKQKKGLEVSPADHQAKQDEFEDEDEEEEEDDITSPPQSKSPAKPAIPSSTLHNPSNPYGLHTIGSQFGLMRPFLNIPNLNLPNQQLQQQHQHQQQQQQQDGTKAKTPSTPIATDSNKALQQMLQEALGSHGASNPFAPTLFQRTNTLPPNSKSSKDLQEQPKNPPLPTTSFSSLLSPLLFNPQRSLFSNLQKQPNLQSSTFGSQNQQQQQSGSSHQNQTTSPFPQLLGNQNFMMQFPQLGKLPSNSPHASQQQNTQQASQQQQIPQQIPQQLPQQIPQQLPQQRYQQSNHGQLNHPQLSAQQLSNVKQPIQQTYREEEQLLCDQLLKDCNKVTAHTRSKVLNFLSGKKDASEQNEVSELLLHEEYKQDPSGGVELHQIFLQMDHSTNSWKKFLKKIGQ